MAQPLGLEITELRLGPPGSENGPKNEKKRVFSELSGEANSTTDGRKTQTTSQVVGWPPVCSYRKKNSFNEKDSHETSKIYVKVSMDGAPFLRKVDLGMHKEYSDLVVALEKLFGCFGIGESSIIYLQCYYYLVFMHGIHIKLP
jgi:auxin-responsive protein IAA